MVGCGGSGGDGSDSPPSPTATRTATPSPTATATPAPSLRAFIAGTTGVELVTGIFQGVALRSDDGGRSWTTVATFDGPMNTIAFADRENGWIGGGLIVSQSDDGGQSWSTVIARTTVFNDLVALSAENAVVVGRIRDFSAFATEILARLDGASFNITIRPHSPVFDLGDLHFLCFLPDGHGISVGSVQDAGALVIIRDFGVSALEISERVQHVPLASGACAGERDFWVVGPGTTIRHSDDQGLIWSDRRDDLAPAFQGDIAAVDFVDRETGWIAGTPAGTPPMPVVLHTVDAGATWERQTLPAIHGRPTDNLDFLPSGAGILVVDEIVSPSETRHVVLVTSDFGATWERATLPPLRTIEDVSLVE